MDNSIAVAAFPPLLLDRWRSSVERLYILSIRVILILPVAEIRYYHRCLADDMGVSDLFSGTMKQNRLYSRLSLFSFSFSLFQLCHNGEAVGTSVHAVKRRSIQQKNSLLAVVHGTKVASSVKHVRKALVSLFRVTRWLLLLSRQHSVNIGFVQGFLSRCLLQE